LKIKIYNRLDGIEYFVTGSAALTDTLGKYESVANLKWYYENNPAFTAISVSRSNLKVQFMDQYQTVKYTYNIFKEVTCKGSAIFALLLYPYFLQYFFGKQRVAVG